MIYISSIIVALALGGCVILQKRSDHYLAEAVRIHDKYNDLIEYMSEHDTITITDRSETEHNFTKNN
jgi:hypothetical protein